jgi:hypothetical protein
MQEVGGSIPLTSRTGSSFRVFTLPQKAEHPFFMLLRQIDTGPGTFQLEWRQSDFCN